MSKRRKDTDIVFTKGHFYFEQEDCIRGTSFLDTGGRMELEKADCWTPWQLVTNFQFLGFWNARLLTFLVRLLIIRVNLTELRVDHVAGKTFILICLWWCFQKRYASALNWVRQMALRKVNIIPSVENQNKTKHVRRANALSDELRHSSSPALGMGAPGSPALGLWNLPRAPQFSGLQTQTELHHQLS